MDIDDSYDGESTTFAWEDGRAAVSVTLPGPVHANYAENTDEVVTASAEGTIRVFASDGSERDAFEYTLPDGCECYTLASSIVTDLGVTMVVGHRPPHRGETFWQHEINLDERTVGGPVAKWR
ncbi:MULTISPECIES: hypothetical protein [unclassified Natrinema]|uniref:hypothetical protein n=1 Tax=unclassified Natrinema TaxID=2622230 RepID=UPI00026D4557|nr:MULTISPECIES: hypothetical protein [unclassified Natrinema]AFO57624.1 hypothetical protein NJ7G_2391 [Natrinema sp. J7-2]